MNFSQIFKIVFFVQVSLTLLSMLWAIGGLFLLWFVGLNLDKLFYFMSFLFK